ncbi:hypothetical protein ERJ75_001716300 [Trypanosoma vivax]|nr:hypothetical protein ERJ75_001716300 [Trypanosoma vivax]
MLACGLALALASLPALASNGQGKALSEDKVQVVCKLSALLKKMSLEAKKLGSVATLATGFEASAAEEDMDVMREALGGAARLLRQRAARGKGTRNETQAREMAQRIVRLHEADQQKALAAKLAENVRQRTALTAAAIDSWIKTFAANYQDANAACIIADSGSGKGKEQALRFNTEDRHAGGCAARAAAVKEQMLPGEKMPEKDNEWEQAVNAAKGSESDMLVGSETDTKCTLTAGTAGNYAGAAEGSKQPWGFFWQLTGSGTASSVALKWSDAHQDLGTEKPKSEDALNEMWLHFKQLKETHRQMHNACNGQAKARQRKHQNAGTLRRRKQEHAPRHSEKVMAEDASDEAHRAQRAARIEHEARTQENANTQKAQHRAAQQRNRTSRRTQGPAPRHAQHRARAQRKQQLPATSTRRSSESCRVSSGARNRKHAHE